MQYERVQQVWTYHDGVRSGIADLNGTPHYFASVFDVRADEYSDGFRLYPIGSEFMQHAIRGWNIYRTWERKFHYGEAESKSHPGLQGTDTEYGRLRSWLDEQIARLEALPTLYAANFRALPGQESLPRGMPRELEVAWSPLSA